MIAAYPPQQTQMQTYNMGYNMQQSPYSTMPHLQERTMIQQQITELYQLPSSTENQEKINKLQERISVIQQHETTDQCLGGTPSCVLQNPIFSMIDSPQVTSTTGRGRGRSNSSKPRKPRQKKSEKQSQAQATEESLSNTINTSNLPVSEDSVTAGTGDLSQIYSEDNDLGDMSQDNSIGDLDTSTDASGKKIKKPRKPRAPKPPKEPKSPKESKKKKEKDPEKPKKSKSKKAAAPPDENSISHDNNSTEFSKQTSEGDDQSLASFMHNQNSTDANSGEGNENTINEGEEIKSGLESKLDNDEVTDFDDIPVSKISVKSLLDDAHKNAMSDEGNAGSEGLSMNEDESPNKKRKSKSGERRKGGMARPRARKGGMGGKSSRRSGRMKIVQDSGDEADDMIGTPPASPTGEDAEIDSSKRRSARNTQRKKYVDDVMLRFSDDEANMIVSPVKQGTPKPTDETKKEKAEGENAAAQPTETTEGQVPSEAEKIIPPEDVSNKPNYVYINTSDEDTMIVQFVLASRMGKRELKPDPPPLPPAPAVVEVKKEETKGEKSESSELKTEPSDENAEASTETKEPKAEAESSEEKMETDENETKEKEPKEKEEDDEIKMELDSAEKEPESEEEKKEEEKPIEESTESKESGDESKEVATPSEESPITTAEGSPAETKPSTDGEEKSSEIKTEVKAEAAEVKDEKPEPVYVEVEEFLVKYRNFSYLHCEWRTEEELLKGDKRVSNKIRRFQQKQAQQFNIFENLEEDPFNPDFVEVDRILDVSEHTDDEGNKNKHYLVKWKSLAYEDSTWELEEDVDEDKIEQFERFHKLPPKSEWKFKKRPHPDQWKQLDKTPIFKNGNTLRPYQLEGLNWLKYSWYKGNNCILADEMGLGKFLIYFFLKAFSDFLILII